MDNTIMIYPSHVTRSDETPSGEYPRFVAVASGKGGVGKTWCTISLAQCFARAGRRVLVFDGDFGLANIDIQLGLVPHHDLVDVLQRRVSLEQAIQHCTFGEVEFDVLPGRAGAPVAAAIGSDTLDGFILSLRRMRRYDVVILDLCAGIDPVTRRLSALSDTLLAVTTEEPTALADVYAVMKLYGRDRVRIAGGDADCRLIVNQAATYRSGRQTYDKLAQACRTFLAWCPELAGIIRKDTRVPTAIRQQGSLLRNFPASPAAVDVGRVADGLLGLDARKLSA